jgi:hypothetical protein
MIPRCWPDPETNLAGRHDDRDKTSQGRAGQGRAGQRFHRAREVSEVS